MNSGENPEVPVLLVDDEPAVLSSMAKVLKSAGIDNLLTCSDSREVLPLMEKQEVEAVLLDISMPGRSGLDILKQLKSEKPALKILILSMHPEEQYAIRALKAGASGYLTKLGQMAEFLDNQRLLDR